MGDVMRLSDDDKHQLMMEEREPHISERARRRGIVSGFLAAKNYWAVVNWLRRGSGLALFISLGDAVDHFRADLAVIPLAREGDGYLTPDQIRARYVVARYFNRHLHGRGADGRPLMGREWFDGQS